MENLDPKELGVVLFVFVVFAQIILKVIEILANLLSKKYSGNRFAIAYKKTADICSTGACPLTKDNAMISLMKKFLQRLKRLEVMTLEARVHQAKVTQVLGEMSPSAKAKMELLTNGETDELLMLEEKLRRMKNGNHKIYGGIFEEDEDE